MLTWPWVRLGPARGLGSLGAPAAPLCADCGRALGSLPSPPCPPAPQPSPVSCTLPRQAFFLGSRPVHPLPTGQARLRVPPPRAPLQTHIQRDSWAPRRPLTSPGGHYLPLLPTSPHFHSDSPALDPWVLAEGAIPGDPPENPRAGQALFTLGSTAHRPGGALHVRLHVQRSPYQPPLRSRSPCWASPLLQGLCRPPARGNGVPLGTARDGALGGGSVSVPGAGTQR